MTGITGDSPHPTQTGPLGPLPATGQTQDAKATESSAGVQAESTLTSSNVTGGPKLPVTDPSTPQIATPQLGERGMRPEGTGAPSYESTGPWDFSEPHLKHLYQQLGGATSATAFAAIFEQTSQLELAKFLQGFPPQIAEALIEIATAEGEGLLEPDPYADPEEDEALSGTGSFLFGGPIKGAQDQRGAFGGDPGHSPTPEDLEKLGIDPSRLGAVHEAQLSSKELEAAVILGFDLNGDLKVIKEAFRFAGSYLFDMVQVLVTLNLLKSTMSTIEGEMVEAQTKAEQDLVKEVTLLAHERIRKAENVRKKNARLKNNDESKWAMFGIMTATTISMTVMSLAMIVMTAGAASPIAVSLMVVGISLLVATTAATITISALDTAGINLFEMIVEDMGLDEDKAWIAKLVASILVLVVAAPLLVVGMFASPGLAMAMLALIPQMLNYSGAASEIPRLIAEEAGMDEKDSMWLGFATNLTFSLSMTVIFIVISMKVAPSASGTGAADDVLASGDDTAQAAAGMGDDLVGQADDLALQQGRAADTLGDTAAGTSQAARAGMSTDEVAKAALTTKAKLRDMATSLKDQLSGETLGEAAQLIEMITKIIQIVSNVMMGITELQKAKLARDVADLRHDLELLNSLVERLQAAIPQYAETRSNLIDDMKDGFMKLALDLHKIFETSVKGASQASTERNRALV